jgi:TonB family protein
MIRRVLPAQFLDNKSVRPPHTTICTMPAGFVVLAPRLPFYPRTFFRLGGAINMGVSWSQRLSAFALTVLLACGLAIAQQSSTDEGKRKVKSRVNPQYSDLARRMGLSGKVKIEIVVATDGHVKSTRAVGGHPLLVQACVDALKDWRYEPGPEETTQLVEFEFKPSQ